MDLGIDGKRALVTGAGGGIGAETVMRLTAAGVAVTATDLTDVSLKALNGDPGIDCIAADLSTTAGIDGLIAQAGTGLDI